MANIKIAQLTNQTAISDADLVIIESATSTNKMTVGKLKELLGIQAGGVVESGSNANGSWIKYADGMMICYGTFDLQLSASRGGVNNQLPQTFLSRSTSRIFFDAQLINGSESLELDAIIANGSVTGSASSFNCYASYYRTGNATDLVNLSYYAIGRWK